MSDIYLAVSETPTVVTLTSAVINSAVASSVTVMNTVTVALDANSLSALENVTVTVGAAITGTVTVSSLPAISGVVTANLGTSSRDEVYEGIFNFSENAQMGVYVTSPIPTGTNSIGRVTVAGTVTIGAGTAQIGSVTASISNFPASTVVCAYGLGSDGTWRGLEMVPGSNRLKVEAINSQGGSNFPVSGSVTLGASTSQIGSVTASISSFATSVTARLINPAGTAVTYAEVGTAGSPSIDVLSVQGVTAGTPINVYPMQGTTVSNTNFTSTTASTSLVSAVTGREVLTVFNEGAGNLHISPGATATTISYQVRLSAGDYWECPAGQLSLAHSAVYATAGTARVTQVS